MTVRLKTLTYFSRYNIYPFFYLVNPFKPNGNSHSYQLNPSISVLWVVFFNFYSKYNRAFFNQTMKKPDQTSSSASFAHVPQKGRYAYMDYRLLHSCCTSMHFRSEWKTVWILLRGLRQKPADLDLQKNDKLRFSTTSR